LRRREANRLRMAVRRRAERERSEGAEISTSSVSTNGQFAVAMTSMPAVHPPLVSAHSLPLVNALPMTHEMAAPFHAFDRTQTGLPHMSAALQHPPHPPQMQHPPPLQLPQPLPNPLSNPQPLPHHFPFYYPPPHR
ncbi:hypothetical protein IW150_007356, partial [Coemansia sp. RSA 2607]